MGRQHSISPEVLDRFAANTATKEERALVVRHLMANCLECHHYLRPKIHPVVPFHDGVYGNAIERSLKRASDAASEAAEADELLAALEAHPPHRQETLARNHPRFRSLPLSNLLLERSEAARRHDLKEAVRLAHLSLLVTSQLETGVEVQEHRVRAWAKLGNVLRLQGEVFAAERAFEEAQRQLTQGRENENLRAQLFSLWASLRFDQRRFEESIRASQEYGRICRRLGDAQEVARAFIQEAIAVLESGRPGRSTHLLVEAARLVDGQREPALVLIIGHNIARAYTDAARPKEALRIYVELRDLYPQMQDSSFQLKGLWLEGEILAALGHLESAASIFRKVHSEFLERGMNYEAALAALDLAGAQAKIGLFSDLTETVQQILPVFRALGIEREVAASVILLTKAAEAKNPMPTR